MTGAAVEANGLTKRYGASTALDSVDLTLQGGIVTILGPNGAGKTTLLRCLATVVAPDDGRVHIDGLDPADERSLIEIRRRLGYAPQLSGGAPDNTVFDVVDYVAVLKGHRDDRSRRRMVVEVLDQVGLREVIGERVGRISGGMQRRVTLAFALLGAPSLLILDEPAAGLDPDERLRLRSLLTERRGRTSIVVSTHLTEEAAMSDRVLVMEAGTIRFAGTPAQLAAVANGRVWQQSGLPPPTVRASWRLVDGSFRCIGQPPPGAVHVASTLEDGYLLTIDPRAASRSGSIARGAGGAAH